MLALPDTVNDARMPRCRELTEKPEAKAEAQMSRKPASPAASRALYKACCDGDAVAARTQISMGADLHYTNLVRRIM